MTGGLIRTSQQPPGRVVVVPDSQFETSVGPEIWDAMLAWIRQQRPSLVLTVGDVTDGSHTFWANWPRARAFFDALTSDGIEWAVATGNHDYTDVVNRVTLINDSLTPSPGWTFMDAGHLENAYKVVSIGGKSWLVLVLEWSPRTAVVAWAGGILAAHADKPAILVTHCYLYRSGVRYDWGTYGAAQLASPFEIGSTPGEGINDGQSLWLGLVEPNHNVRVVLSGHVGPPPGPCFRSDVRASGKVCHQLVQDYQDEEPFGGGWLVTYEIDHVNGEIIANTYSPYLKRAMHGENANDLRLKIPD